jgi:hypothetical protein
MHWILQENLFKETEWVDLVGALERFNIPYSVHKVVPFIGELIPPAEPTQKNVICYGSYSMRHVAKENRWIPGVFDIFDQDFTVQLEHWGDLRLNHDSQVMKFKDAPLLTGPLFIRPIDDSKYFAGKVFWPEDFNEWKHKVVDLGEDYGNSLTGDTYVQTSSPKVIFAEYRYWIIDGRIVTKSLYKRGDKVIYSPVVDARIDRFVHEVLNHGDILADTVVRGWMPARAFVLDVCETDAGMKIVEINTINAAGFYAGNIQDIVLAVEAMKFQDQ